MLRSRINPKQVMRWGISIAVFFGAWQYLGSTGALFYVKPPSLVFQAMWQEIVRGEILSATLGTLKIALMAFGIGAVLGITIGTITGTSEKWAWVIDPLVSAGWAVPIVMFIPVISIYSGIEVRGKVVLTLFMNIFVIIVNTSTGVKEVPANVKEMARAFGVSRSGTYTKIILPWASPYILTGLRLGLGRSVQGAILADLFLRADNLGLYIVEASSSFNLEILLAAVLFITAIAATAMLLARGAEWWLLRWKSV
jgi:ABC-type nitrate/sulfonate/bicarbonate transport system permease component